ncbi:MAG: YkgJ family cysteine cluster protein [Desulfuromonadaceae bacterium]|nr:YkgJ family cysteine cluster protein [Desulfuromonadaceae bacterium]
MAQSGLDLLDNELAAVLVDALGNGSAEEALVQGVTLCADVAEAHCVDREMACTRGCPHCCVLNVSVLLPEAMRIAETIKTKWSEPGWNALQKRLVRHSNWERWMDDEERVMRGAFCPLLDTNGFCLIHPVRPLVCRGVASLDSNCCRSAFDPIIDGHDRSVPADLQRRAVYDQAFMALGMALANNGLDDRSIELGVGILAFAQHPEFKALYLAGGRLPRELWG